MAELTEYQVDQAARVGSRVASDLGYPERLAYATQEEHKLMTHQVMRAAAPYLQMPWDEPNGHEVTAASKTTFATGLPSEVLKEFVRNRNAALLPKPVDPRRERIIYGIRKRNFPMDLESELKMVDDILAALDAQGTPPFNLAGRV